MWTWRKYGLRGPEYKEEEEEKEEDEEENVEEGEKGRELRYMMRLWIEKQKPQHYLTTKLATLKTALYSGKTLSWEIAFWEWINKDASEN